MQDVRARQEREAKQRGMVHDVMCCAGGRGLEGQWCSFSPLLCVGGGRLAWDVLRLRRKELVVQWTKTKSDAYQLGSFSGVEETLYVSTHSHLFNRRGEQRSVVRREKLHACVVKTKI